MPYVVAAGVLIRRLLSICRRRRASVANRLGEELKLSESDIEAYQAMWGASGSSVDGTLSGTKASGLFSASGLSKSRLKKIWSLSDKSTPHGVLTQSEFYVALKLIALEQLDPDAGISTDTAAALARTGVPLPQLGDLTTSLGLEVSLSI